MPDHCTKIELLNPFVSIRNYVIVSHTTYKMDAYDRKERVVGKKFVTYAVSRSYNVIIV